MDRDPAPTDWIRDRKGPVEIWHLTIPSGGRQALFPTEGVRRRAVHALARVATDRLAHFCIVDEHVHLIAVCSRASAGRLARSVELSLGALGSVPLASAHFTPVETRKHLERLVGYLARQPARHGLPHHPALWTGSAHLDLLGARVIPRLRLRLGEVLPRFGPRRIAEAIGLGRFGLHPMPLDELRRRGAFGLAAAASAAFAARPDLRTNERSARDARVAVAVLGRDAGISIVEMTDALGVRRRSVRRLSERRADPRGLQAVRLRLALERHLDGDGRLA